MTTIETPSVIRRLWKSVLALGVLTLALGAAVLIWPGDAIVVAAVVFGVYLLVSGIAQAIAAFAVDMSTATRVLYFISGALSVVLGYFAFRDFNNGAASGRSRIRRDFDDLAGIADGGLAAGRYLDDGPAG